MQTRTLFIYRISQETIQSEMVENIDMLHTNILQDEVSFHSKYITICFTRVAVRIGNIVWEFIIKYEAVRTLYPRSEENFRVGNFNTQKEAIRRLSSTH